MSDKNSLIKDAEGAHRLLYKALADLVVGGDKLHQLSTRIYGETRNPEARQQLADVMAHLEAALKFADASIADARAAYASLKEITGCNGACEKP